MRATATRPGTRARFGGSVAAALCLAGGLAGCSSGHPSAGGSASRVPSSAGSGSGVLLAAYHNSIGKQTAKMSVTESIAASAGSAAPTGGVTSGAAPSGASARGAVGGGEAATVTASGVVNFTTKAFDATLRTQGLQAEIREIGNEVYLRLPASLAGKLPSGKSWISVDLDKISQAKLGASLSSITNTSRANPADMLAYLGSVSSSGVHKVGAQTIRGTATTEYNATVDLDKLANQQPNDAARSAIKRLEEQVGAGYPIEVWVDKSGLVRQLRFAITAHPATSAPRPSSTPLTPASSAPYAVAVRATIQLYDYGTPATVTAPPSSQTFDLTGQVASASP